MAGKRIVAAAGLLACGNSFALAQTTEAPWVNPLPKGTSTIPDAEGRFVACLPPDPAPADFRERCAAFLAHKKLARVARPRGQEDWLRTSDFRATPHPKSGVTTVSVKIDAEGRVSDCLASTAGDFAALDSQVCTFVTERARFSPARDDDGAPKASSFGYPFRWK